MCTAITFKAKNNYFGRTLDLEKRYDENVVITPRNFILRYRMGEIDRKHLAFIGTATVIDDYPLYYDATNEFGLSIAGLNFVGNAYLNRSFVDGKLNLAPFELIPYLLSKFKTCAECMEYIKFINIVDERFKDDMPNAELHWLIADNEECFVLEITGEGTKIYDNPVGVLTNNPPFNYQMINLVNYLNLTSNEATNRFSDNVKLIAYCKGMGAIGLPGDNSSMSRFVRASFTKMNSVKPDTDELALTQAFHILSSVEQQEGTVITNGEYERTQYTSCCDTSNCVYYYKTYENSQISSVDIFKEDLECNNLISYKMNFTPHIYAHN